MGYIKNHALFSYELKWIIFGNLEDIFVIDNRVLSVLETSNFNVHLQAHTVNHTQDREILLHKNLPSPFSMHIHRITVDNSSFSVIICKYHICNVLYIVIMFIQVMVINKNISVVYEVYRIVTHEAEKVCLYPTHFH